MSDVATWVAWLVSAACTALCWVRVARSQDLVFFKVAGAIIAAVPFVGPVLFLFLDLPPRLPEEAQVKMEWSKGTTVRSQITRELFVGNRKHLNALHGVGKAKVKAGRGRRGT